MKDTEAVRGENWLTITRSREVRLCCVMEMPGGIQETSAEMLDVGLVLHQVLRDKATGAERGRDCMLLPPHILAALADLIAAGPQAPEILTALPHETAEAAPVVETVCVVTVPESWVRDGLVSLTGKEQETTAKRDAVARLRNRLDPGCLISDV